MRNFTENFLNAVDNCIQSEEVLPVFDLEILLPDSNENVGTITPIWTTFDEDYGSVFILEIKETDVEINYIQIIYGDGGVMISRSEPTNNFKDLMFKSQEEWSKL